MADLILHIWFYNLMNKYGIHISKHSHSDYAPHCRAHHKRGIVQEGKYKARACHDVDSRGEWEPGGRNQYGILQHIACRVFKLCNKRKYEYHFDCIKKCDDIEHCQPCPGSARCPLEYHNTVVDAPIVTIRTEQTSHSIFKTIKSKIRVRVLMII